MPSKQYEERIDQLIKLRQETEKEAHRQALLLQGRDENGRLLPGNTANKAGKKKGTRNKWNKEVKQKLREVVSPYLTLLNDDLAKLEPFDRIKAVVMLLKQCEIRGKGQNGSGNVQNNITFEVTYSDEYKRRKRNRNTIDITPDEYKVEDSTDEDDNEDED